VLAGFVAGGAGGATEAAAVLVDSVDPAKTGFILAL
jgi:hypothetical protein